MPGPGWALTRVYIYYWQRRPGIGSYKKTHGTLRSSGPGCLVGRGKNGREAEGEEGQACGRCLAGGAGAERPRAMCPPAGPVRPTAPESPSPEWPSPELAYARSRAYSAAAASVASSPAQSILEEIKNKNKKTSNNHNNSIHGLEICCDPSVHWHVPDSSCPRPS
jgi:hypothetical protein